MLVHATSTDKTLKVGIDPFTPFIISSEGIHTGFFVDLWEVIAQELDVEYEFIWSSGVGEKLLFGYFIAELSSNLTLSSLHSSIYGPED